MVSIYHDHFVLPPNKTPHEHIFFQAVLIVHHRALDQIDKVVQTIYSKYFVNFRELGDIYIYRLNQYVKI